MKEIIMNPETMTMFLFHGTFLVMLLTLIVLGIVFVLMVQTNARSNDLKREYKVIDGEIEELFKIRLEDHGEFKKKFEDYQKIIKGE